MSIFEGLFEDILECEIQASSDLSLGSLEVLWDGYTDAVDYAIESRQFFDIKFAMSQYSVLIDEAQSLPEAQAEHWIGRADDYLPLFWMVWVRWVEQYECDETKHHGQCS